MVVVVFMSFSVFFPPHLCRKDRNSSFTYIGANKKSASSTEMHKYNPFYSASNNCTCNSRRSCYNAWARPESAFVTVISNTDLQSSVCSLGPAGRTGVCRVPAPRGLGLEGTERGATDEHWLLWVLWSVWVLLRVLWSPRKQKIIWSLLKIYREVFKQQNCCSCRALWSRRRRKLLMNLLESWAPSTGSGTLCASDASRL